MAYAEAVGAERNNAAWCDTVCRVHGTAGVRDADAWSVPRRSPPWYPDAVTLRPQARGTALLTDPTVTVLAAYDPVGAVTGGAVVSRGGGTLGVSNAFDTDPAAVRRGVCAHVGAEPLVGWETADDLPPALDVGFRRVGPLRVWLRPPD